MKGRAEIIRLKRMNKKLVAALAALFHHIENVERVSIIFVGRKQREIIVNQTEILLGEYEESQKKGAIKHAKRSSGK